MVIESAAVRVARGVALLDERRPGWWEKIDVAAFNINHPCRCVIGFVEGDYCRRDNIDTVLGDDSVAAALGFDTFAGKDLPEFLLIHGHAEFRRIQAEDAAALQAEWLRVLAERKAEAPVVTWAHRERTGVSA